MLLATSNLLWSQIGKPGYLQVLKWDKWELVLVEGMDFRVWIFFMFILAIKQGFEVASEWHAVSVLLFWASYLSKAG